MDELLNGNQMYNPTEYQTDMVYITMKMYPCSGGTDTVSPGL